MSEQDKWDELVAELLPCRAYNDVVICYDHESGTTVHEQQCVAKYRSAVASKLREQGIQLDAARDKAIRFDLDQAGITQREREAVELVELRAEIERLRAQIHKAAGHRVHSCVCVFEAEDDSPPIRECNYHLEQTKEIAQLKAQLAEAEKRGMDRAIEIADNWRDDGSDKWVGRQIATILRTELERL